MPTLGPPGVTLSFEQLKELWVRNGGNPAAAPIMAAIALAESGGLSNNLNPNGRDYSVGLWQINYFGALRPGRTASYGSPEALAADVDKQARAAIAISGNGKNLQPWTTYTSGDADRILNRKGGNSLGGLPQIPATPALPSGDRTGPRVAGATSTEGDLFKIHIVGTDSDIKMGRATARKLVGAAVIVAGGSLALAGVFVLVGTSKRLPALMTGPTSLLGGAQRAKGAVTEEKIEKPAAKAKDAAFRQGRRDELGERRDAKERREVAGYQSAREQGEAAARAAGDF